MCDFSVKVLWGKRATLKVEAFQNWGNMVSAAWLALSGKCSEVLMSQIQGPFLNSSAVPFWKPVTGVISPFPPQPLPPRVPSGLWFQTSQDAVSVPYPLSWIPAWPFLP